MAPGWFGREVTQRLERVKHDRRQAEVYREKRFAYVRNVYRDLRDNGNERIVEGFRRTNRRKLFFAAGLIFAVLLHRMTDLSFVLWLAACVPACMVLAYYNERQRAAAKKRPILRHYD